MKLLAIFFYYIKIHIFLIRQFYAISLITNKNHKMNRKYFKYINTLFVVIPMTLIMAFVGLMRNYCNYGFGEDWLFKFLKAWSVVLRFYNHSEFACEYSSLPKTGKKQRGI